MFESCLVWHIHKADLLKLYNKVRLRDQNKEWADHSYVTGTPTDRVNLQWNYDIEKAFHLVKTNIGI